MEAFPQLLVPAACILHAKTPGVRNQWRASSSVWEARTRAREGGIRETMTLPHPKWLVQQWALCHGAHWGENVHCRTQMPKWRRKRVLPQLHLAFWQAFHTLWLMLPACICSLIVSLVTYELSFTHLDHTLLGTWLNVPLLCLFSSCWEPFQRNQYQEKNVSCGSKTKRKKEKRKFSILDHQ